MRLRSIDLALVVFAGCGPSPTESPWAAPANTWPVSAPPEGLVGEGFELGQVIPDLRLVDQHGDTVSTWQFWGELVLVTVSAVWCDPCHDLAVAAEEVRADYAIPVLTILEEDGGGLAPEVSDAVAWGEMFGNESPILVDPEHLFSPALDGSYPAVLLLDDLVVVARAGELSSANLHDLIESEL